MTGPVYTASEHYYPNEDYRVADREIVELARIRQTNFEHANLFSNYFVDAELNGQHPLRKELATIVDPADRSEWARERIKDGVKALDLAFVENGGSWEVTTPVDVALGQLGVRLQREGLSDGYLDRHDKLSNCRLMVEPQVISARGLVLMRRKRKLLETYPQLVAADELKIKDESRVTRFLTANPAEDVFETQSVIDKHSEFQLNLSSLKERSAEVFDEVADIIMSQAIGRLASKSALQLIEQAIDERDSALLVPSATSFHHENRVVHVPTSREA